MRLGAPIFADAQTPESWIDGVKAKGFRAAYCPLQPDADDQTVRDFADAAREADILIAEVGAWSNPLSPDEDERRRAVEKCKRSLDLAERIGANQCVNISGSRGAQWDGPHHDNFSDETFEMIVETTRDIIDSVKPARTFYSLETMPWAFPDSPETYLRLLEAIDRKGFGVHFDPVNMINSPRRFWDNAGLVREFCALLGPHIKGVHAKDIRLGTKLTVHLDEVRPGEGGLDYRALLREINRLDADIPFMLEHLPTENDYDLAAKFVRGVADELSIAL